MSLFQNGHVKSAGIWTHFIEQKFLNYQNLLLSVSLFFVFSFMKKQSKVTDIKLLMAPIYSANKKKEGKSKQQDYI